MSELIKSVRVRARQEPSGYKSGAFEGGLLDFKVSIQRISKRERACSSFNLTKTGEESSQFWYALFYKGNRYEDLTDDELIADYIRTNTIRENPKLVDGKIDVMEEIPGEFLPNGSPAYRTEKKPYYEIIQDPFSKTPPASRVYGRDPYFLNNGAQVYIKWFASEPISVFYEFKNLTSASQSAIGEVTIQIVTNQPNKEPLVFTYSASNNPIQAGLTPSYNDIETYWDWSTRPGLNQISFVGYLSPGERFVDPNSLKVVDGIKYGVESKEYFSIDGYIDDARDSMTPSISIKPEGLVKKVEVVPPTNDDKVWVLSDLTDDIIYDFYPIYKEEIIGTGSSASESSTPSGKSEKYFFDNSFNGDFRTGQDWMILNDLLQAWNKKIPNYNVDIAKPSFVVPNEPINYVDPIKPIEDPEPITPQAEPEVNTKSNLKVYFPPDFEVNVREDCPEFKIFIGDIPKELEPGEGFQFQDDFEDLKELDDEYSESQFVGPEEDIDQITGVAFTATELKRDPNEPAPEASPEEQKEANVQFGGSNVTSPSGSVSKNKVEVPAELAAVQNSAVLKKQSMGNGKLRDIADVTNPSGDKIKADNIVSDMNKFISDVLGPFAKWLKQKYPNLYKSWYITSATRGYVPSGGSLTSQHFKGQAIDSQILGSTSTKPEKNIELMNAILEWYKENPVGYGQILFETRGSSCWIHWSYTRGNTRLMFARFSNDSTLKAPSNKTGSYVLPPVTKKSLGF